MCRSGLSIPVKKYIESGDAILLLPYWQPEHYRLEQVITKLNTGFDYIAVTMKAPKTTAHVQVYDQNYEFVSGLTGLCSCAKDLLDSGGLTTVKIIKDQIQYYINSRKIDAHDIDEISIIWTSCEGITRTCIMESPRLIYSGFFTGTL